MGRHLFICIIASVGVLGWPHPVRATLFISEVVDGTLPGGQPKFVELTNLTGASVNLSGYSLGNYNNGSTSLFNGTSYVLSGTLAHGDSWVVAFDDADALNNSVFFDVYGFNADDLGAGAYFNGDDAIALFLADGNGPGGAAIGDGSDATIIDVFGQVGVDGSAQFWEYTDGYAYRKLGVLTGNAGVFSQANIEQEWVFGGPNSLETGNDDQELLLLRGLTTPGELPVPEPTSATVLLSAAIILVSRRRLVLGQDRVASVL